MGKSQIIAELNVIFLGNRPTIYFSTGSWAGWEIHSLQQTLSLITEVLKTIKKDILFLQEVLIACSVLGTNQLYFKSSFSLSDCDK